MKIVMMGRGGGTDMPTFNELYPDLIDPQKLRVYDGFGTHPNGALRLRPLPVANAGQGWTLGSTATYFQVQDGEAHSTTTGYIGTPVSADGKVYAAIRWGISSSFAGLLVRFVDVNDYGARVSLSAVSGGQVRVEKREGGETPPVLSITPLPLVVGNTYLLSVEFSGASYIVRVNGSVVVSFENAAHMDKTGVGMSSGNTAHKYLEFSAGAE